jgi:hypothetical protein
MTLHLCATLALQSFDKLVLRQARPSTSSSFDKLVLRQAQDDRVQALDAMRWKKGRGVHRAPFNAFPRGNYIMS